MYEVVKTTNFSHSWFLNFSELWTSHFGYKFRCAVVKIIKNKNTQINKQQMAQTAHKTEEEKKEYFDSPEVLDEKVGLLANMI